MQNYKGALFDHVLFPGESGVAWSQSRYQCLNKGSTEGPWTVCSEFLCKQPFAQCFPRNCPFHFEYPEQWVIVSITTWKTDPFLQNLYYDDSAAHCPALKKYTFHLFCSSIGTKLGSDCTPPPAEVFYYAPPPTPNRKGGGGYWFWCGSRRRPLSFLYALYLLNQCVDSDQTCKTHYWDGEKKCLVFGDLDLIFKVISVLWIVSFWPKKLICTLSLEPNDGF